MTMGREESKDRENLDLYSKTSEKTAKVCRYYSVDLQEELYCPSSTLRMIRKNQVKYLFTLTSFQEYEEPVYSYSTLSR